MNVSAASSSAGAISFARSSTVSGERPEGAERLAGRKTAERTAGMAGAVDASASPPGYREDMARVAELAEIRSLQKRDREVRQHEMAHLAASGGLALSGASYSFRRGPDGVAYAVGGEVSIDTSPGRTPQETLQRAETIVRAALAPAEPSPQDRAVAAKARQMGMQAMAQQFSQQGEGTGSSNPASREHPGINLYRQNAREGGTAEATEANLQPLLDVTV